MMKAQIDWVIANRPCGTLVVDTMDWAEKLIVKKVLSSSGKSSIEDFGYGKGYTYVWEEMGRLLNQLSQVVDAGMNVVITAHAAMRKVEQPDEMGSYDHWELKLSKQSSPLVKEWADLLLFCNYKTYVVKAEEKDKKGKAQGGRRVMYTTHHPCWDAKNRYGLPDQVDMGYQALQTVIEDGAPADTVEQITPVATPAPAPRPEEPPIPVSVQQNTEQLPQQPSEEGIPPALADLMKANKVSAQEIQAVVGLKGYFPGDMPIQDYPPDFVDGVLVGAWSQVYDCILESRDVPF
jgi:hypothetical protein